jgi:acetyl-CoA acetyltransferase
LTLAKEMKRRNVQFGLATLCIGGGQGGAVIIENEN